MAEEEQAASNVRALILDGSSAEDMLRAGLAECAETRSRGKEPQVMVMILEDGCPPGIYRTPMILNDLSACATLMQVISNRAFMEWLEERDGE